MRRWLSPLILFAVLISTPVGPALAQASGVEVSVLLDETVFLPGEEIPVGVRVANLSGRPVTFGSTSNWLTFHVETSKGDIVSRLGEVPVLGEFTLESAKAGTKWWNVQPYFDLEGTSLYVVYAEIRIPEWGQRLISDPVSFSLQSARKLWEVDFGVPPSSPEAAGRPEIRHYALLSATRSNERKLFVRTSDAAEAHIFRVVLIDRLLTFASPDQQLDNQSRLHVLLQTAGSSYTYCVVDPSGLLAVRQRYDIIPGSRPRLAKREDGAIEVLGGRRHPTDHDLPVAPAVSTPAPSSTSVTAR